MGREAAAVNMRASSEKHLPKQEQHRLEVLEARGLTYHPPDTGKGVEAVDLSLRRGSFTVVIGRIGSGKTALLRLLIEHAAGLAQNIRALTWIYENQAAIQKVSA